MKLQVTLLCFSLLPVLEATTFQHRAAYNALHTLMKRRFCGQGNTCADACGPGYEQCVSETMCYNPTVGDQCCSTGEYCPKGEYCAKTSTGAAVCCTDGVSLADCGAVATVETIAPAAATTAAPTTAAATVTTTTHVGTLTPVSYANTTFTKKTTATGSTAAGSTPAGPVEPGQSTAYSTTTIPLPGGGFVTSTAFTAVPTSGSSAAPTILQASDGEEVSPRGIYWVVWSALMLGLGAILA